jgi:hypothetical protein
MGLGQVAGILGEHALYMLENRSLVSKGIDGTVLIHHVMLNVGHQKAERMRLKLKTTNQIDKLLNRKEEKVSNH